MAAIEGQEEKKCSICQGTSRDRILLCAEYRGQEIRVCVACLPRVIHGAH